VRITRIDHVQLAMPPGLEQAATDFYVGLLGLERVAKPSHLEARGGCWFEGGTVRLHLGVEQDFRPAKKAHVALLVDDLGALAKKLARAGVAVRTDEPLEGYDRVYVDDVFGNRVELLEQLAAEPALPVAVRRAGPGDRAWLSSVLEQRWGSTTVVSRGRSHEASQLEALVAAEGGEGGARGERLGVATYVVDDRELEVVSLDALVAGRGVGTALLAAAKEVASAQGCGRLWLITSNDNLDALRFYQRRGLRLVAVHRGAVDRARESKPQIPEAGCFGIPVHDEVELEVELR
jgi:GNAT superfamily N-acetyltransferase